MDGGKGVRSELCVKMVTEQSERWIKERKELIAYGKHILWNMSWNYYQMEEFILYINLSTTRWDSFAVISRPMGFKQP